MPFVAHRRPLTGTEWYCLVTEAHICEQLAQGIVTGLFKVVAENAGNWTGDLYNWASNALTIATPDHILRKQWWFTREVWRQKLSPCKDGWRKSPRNGHSNSCIRLWWKGGENPGKRFKRHSNSDISLCWRGWSKSPRKGRPNSCISLWRRLRGKAQAMDILTPASAADGGKR